MVDFGTKVLGTQNANLLHLSDFKKDISDSRTFSFLHELEMLLERGLIKGGDLNNAIVYVDKPLSEETMERLKLAFNKESISVTSNGILDNLTLHHPNEAARHKLLDVIGDLALIGTRIQGKVIANILKIFFISFFELPLPEINFSVCLTERESDKIFL